MAFTIPQSKTLVKRFTLFASAFLFLFILVLPSIKVSAASNFDDAYQTTGAFMAGRVGGTASYDCGPVGVPVGIRTDLLEELPQWQQDEVNAAMAAGPTFMAATQQVSYGTQGGQEIITYTPSIYIGKSNSTNPTLVWANNTNNGTSWVNLTSDNNLIRLHYSLVNGEDCELALNFNNSLKTVPISDAGPYPGLTESYTRNLYITDEVDYNYPSGYEGTPVVESYEEIIPIQYPHLNYEVNDKTVELTYQENIDFPGGDECQVLNYTFYNSSGGRVHEISTGYDRPINDTISYEYSEYGAITVSAVWHPLSNAGCPDFDKERARTDIAIILDGKPQFGDNYSGDNCDSLGTCTAPTAIRDCSVYNPITDMGEFVVCWIENMFTITKSWFTSLFIPRAGFIGEKIDEFTNKMLENESVLTYPATWYINMTNTMINTEPNCNLTVNGFYDASATWDLCRMKNDFPSVWNLAINLTRIFLLMSLFLAFYLIYLKIWTKS